jgi:eukaryotic-like serine/threonine-protein kinase
MTSPPPDSDFSASNEGDFSLNLIGQTSGFDHERKLEETSADNSNTRHSPKGRRTKRAEPHRIGGYELEELIGQGGMGRVYRAKDLTGRFVALKLLSPDLARSAEALARFKQEGLIAGQLNHPNCVFVHRVDEDSGTPFIAMELMTGQTLKDLVLLRGPLPYQEAIRLILQCIDGLIAAHTAGMIHRDIKPANCYLDDTGNVKVGDFGLARSLVGDSELTQAGAFLGTPLFASPEQLIGQAIDARSDIYSLTSTLYYLLAGKAPFESPHPAQVIAKIVSAEPPSFQSAGVHVPPALERVVMKGLERDTSKRYASVVQLRYDLEDALQPKSGATTLSRRTLAWIGDYFIITTIVAGALLLIAILSDATKNPFLAKLISTVLVFSYFLGQESLFSTSVGKAAMRIAVVDKKTGLQPSLLQVLTRSLIYAVSSSLPILAIKFMLPHLDSQWDVLLGCCCVILNAALLASTWTATKKRQLLHDWMSGTECRTQIAANSDAPIQLGITDWRLPLKKNLGSAKSMPETIGRFSIEGEIAIQQTDHGARWYLARDPQLDRAIWIAHLDGRSLALAEAQFCKPKSMRLRLVEEGNEGDSHWFAFVATDGVPLQECVNRGVQLPWPITRTILTEYAELNTLVGDLRGETEKQALENLIHPERIWIEPSGRLTIVDFVLKEPNASLSKGGTIEQSLIRQVALLGLPASHPLRTPKRSHPVKSAVPHIDGLPSLRAYKLLEVIASAKLEPTLRLLSEELTMINKNTPGVTSRLRFLSASVTVGLMSPLMFLAVVLLFLPSILQTTNLLKEVRHIKSLTAFAKEPERFQSAWSIAAPEAKVFWTQEENQIRLKMKLERQSRRFESAWDQLGNVERFVIKSISSQGKTFTEPQTYGSDATNRTEVIDARLMANIIASGESTAITESEEIEFPDGQLIAIGILICILWTTVTLGGIVQYVTGTCICNWDGRSLGLLQSFWRATALYLPIFGLVMSIVYCNALGLDYVWYGTQLKRIFLIAPIAVLATTILWSRKTPLDVISNTVMIPR